MNSFSIWKTLSAFPLLIVALAANAEVITTNKQDFIDDFRQIKTESMELLISDVENPQSVASANDGCYQTSLDEFLSEPETRYFIEAHFELAEISLEKVGLVAYLKQGQKQLLSTSHTLDTTTRKNQIEIGSLNLSGEQARDVTLVYCLTKNKNTRLSLKSLKIYRY